MHKTAKYHIVKPLDTTWEVFGQVLSDVQYSTWKALNRTLQMMWEWDGLGAQYKKATGVYPTKSDMVEWSTYKGIDGYIYDILKDEFPIIHTSNLTQTIQMASKRWKEDRKAIWTGEKSIPSYKRTAPILLNPNNIKKPYNTDSGYAIDISLISGSKAKELERRNGIFPMAIIAGDGSQRATLNRIISGQYKIAGSKIIRERRTKKWMLLLTYSFEQKDTDLLEENVMGVDLGVAIPLYMAFNNSLARYHVNGGEIEQFRRGIEARRKSVLKQGKYCGDGRRGHGRDTRIKPIDKLSETVGNFRDTINHKYSRYIVDMAAKHKCATIQMEDLEGITDGADRFLKNWTYFDLQTKIEYKAQEAGVRVVKIDPAHTSRRCSQCGYIDERNRSTQADFQCLKCGYKENADYNAARNISILNIENIIREQLEKQREAIAKCEFGCLRGECNRFCVNGPYSQ